MVGARRRWMREQEAWWSEDEETKRDGTSVIVMRRKQGATNERSGRGAVEQGECRGVSSGGWWLGSMERGVRDEKKHHDWGERRNKMGAVEGSMLERLKKQE